MYMYILSRRKKMRKLYRNGDSLLMTVPKEYAKALGLDSGVRVSIELKNGGMFIRRSK